MRLRKSKKATRCKSNSYFVRYPRGFSNEYHLTVKPGGARASRGEQKITRAEFMKLERKRHYGITTACKKCGYLPGLPAWMSGTDVINHRG